MNPEQFKLTEPILDSIADEVDDFFEGKEGNTLRDLLVKLSTQLEGEFGVEMQLVVNIIDWKREASLPLLQTGLSVDADKTYRTHGDSSLHRYIASGEIVVIPNDYCPKCWGQWGFKLEHPVCPSCSAKLGEEVLLLLDSDLCPHCEKGKLSAQNPACDRCGFEVNPNVIHWG